MDYTNGLACNEDVITTLRATIEARDAEIADLKHDTDELIRVRREVIKRADAAESRVKELEQDLTAMTSRYSRAAGDIASLEQELADRKDRIAELTMIGDMDRARLVMRER